MGLDTKTPPGVARDKVMESYLRENVNDPAILKLIDENGAALGLIIEEIAGDKEALQQEDPWEEVFQKTIDSSEEDFQKMMRQLESLN